MFGSRAHLKNDYRYRMLSANLPNRYVLNLPILSQFERDEERGLTFFIQCKSPSKEREANWLIAPKWPFFNAMRIYWSEEEALNGEWKAPKIEQVKSLQ